jgi:SOS response associated peptidase (SRAP)
MCGRYRLSRRKQIVEEYFDSVSDEQDWGPRYNITPTQPVPVIRQNAEKPVRELSLMRWGLIPSWAKDASGAASMINARSETASTQVVDLPETAPGSELRLELAFTQSEAPIHVQIDVLRPTSFSAYLLDWRP